MFHILLIYTADPVTDRISSFMYLFIFILFIFILGGGGGGGYFLGRSVEIKRRRKNEADNRLRQYV